nr:translation initiation factor IF-2-like [Dermacentor andersoni]
MPPRPLPLVKAGVQTTRGSDRAPGLGDPDVAALGTGWPADDGAVSARFPARSGREAGEDGPERSSAKVRAPPNSWSGERLARTTAARREPRHLEGISADDDAGRGDQGKGGHTKEQQRTAMRKEALGFKTGTSYSGMATSVVAASRKRTGLQSDTDHDDTSVYSLSSEDSSDDDFQLRQPPPQPKPQPKKPPGPQPMAQLKLQSKPQPEPQPEPQPMLQPMPKPVPQPEPQSHQRIQRTAVESTALTPDNLSEEDQQVVR